jgi:hypothetical protein
VRLWGFVMARRQVFGVAAPGIVARGQHASDIGYFVLLRCHP